MIDPESKCPRHTVSVGAWAPPSLAWVTGDSNSPSCFCLRRMLPCAQHNIPRESFSYKRHRVTALLRIRQRPPAPAAKASPHAAPAASASGPWPPCCSRLSSTSGFELPLLPLPGMFFSLEHYSFFYSFQISAQASLCQ